MFDPTLKSTGTTYTTSVALLAVACIFIPAVLVISSPVQFSSLYLALAGSTLSLALAWFNWRWHSRLSISSISAPIDRSKA
jgi:hypothetical protein